MKPRAPSRERLLALLVASNLVLVACEPGDRPSRGERGDTSSPLTLVGSVATEESPGHEPWVSLPRNIAPLPGGRVVVLDAQEPRLVVFDTSAAAPLVRFGRQGQGPGEISGAWAALWPDSTGAILVADPGNRRVMTFDADGALLGEVPIAGDVGGIFAWRPRPWSDQLYAQSWTTTSSDGPLRFEDSLAEVDLESGTLRPILRLPDRAPPPDGAPGRVLFAPRSLWTILGNGEIIVARSDSSVFRVYAPDGALLREFSIAYSARSLDDTDKQDLVRELRDRGDLGDGSWAMHSRLPMARNVWTVNDTLFALEHSRVSTPAELAPPPWDSVEWSMITTRGEVVGRLMLPHDFTALWVWNEEIYGIQRDALGVAEIQAFHIDLMNLGGAD